MPLLSVILESRGHSASMIGLNTAVAGLASIAGGPAGDAACAAIRRRPRRCSLMIVGGALAFVGFYFAPSFWMWFPLRVVLHVALTVLFILSEFWISVSAPPHRRGFVLGIYATVLSLGFAFGPWLFAQMGSAGFLPFGVAFALVILAAMPVLAAGKREPGNPRSERRAAAISSATSGWCRPRLRRFWCSAPSRLAALRCSRSMATASAIREADAALLLTMIGLGNVILQIPLGIISDRIRDRRVLLAACAGIGLAGMLALPFLARQLASHRRDAVRLGRRGRRALHDRTRPSRLAADRPANSPRPTLPSCSATDSACCSARRRSASAWTFSAQPASAMRWRCFFIAYLALVLRRMAADRGLGLDFLRTIFMCRAKFSAPGRSTRERAVPTHRT